MQEQQLGEVSEKVLMDQGIPMKFPIIEIVGFC